MIFLEDYLTIPIINNAFISLDYWSFIHFITGCLFGYFLGKKRFGWLITLVCLTGYEIIENRFLVDIIFFREPMVNWVWDILVGISAFLIVSKILKIKEMKYGKIKRNTMAEKAGKQKDSKNK